MKILANDGIAKNAVEILNENGWQSELTPISNDQGADVIAKKGLIKLVLQCKNLEKMKLKILHKTFKIKPNQAQALHADAQEPGVLSLQSFMRQLFW